MLRYKNGHSEGCEGKEADDRIQIREHGDMVRWGANILSLNVLS